VTETPLHGQDARARIRRLVGITGASGFLGGYIARCLFESGRYDVRALSRSATKADAAPAGISWERGDLTSPKDCENFTRDLSAVIHLAHANTPLSSHRDWASDAFLNVMPTLNLIEALRKQERRVDLIFASSGGAVYGRRSDPVPFNEDDATHPSSPYGIVKLAIENYLRLATDEGWLRVVVLRIGNPYGILLPPQRRQGLIGVAMNQVLRGEPVPLFGEPGNVRDYIHLSDLAAIVERCLQPQRAFDIYNVGSGRGASTEEVLDLIERSVGGHIMRQPLAGIDNANRLVPWVVLDVAKAATELAWRPQISLETGIERLYREYRDARGGPTIAGPGN